MTATGLVTRVGYTGYFGPSIERGVAVFAGDMDEALRERLFAATNGAEHWFKPGEVGLPSTTGRPHIPRSWHTLDAEETWVRTGTAEETAGQTIESFVERMERAAARRDARAVVSTALRAA